jgi:hypothetical protein
MHLIKSCVVVVVKEANDTASNGDRHTKNVDEQVQLVLHHTSKSNQKKILNHGSSLGAFYRRL